ncbi:putative general alpha-glucoside permease protein [Phaeoacremonium minimum UCRPA7]|uniref:Putative general alpha-glucoside permease protein n=1 Tax=Phaeoacremonium minimum (strain UCR-PA7) TaxID=1286976 RepID=R8BYC2_PHAM7|nr:putative general alpha-glucoside permease protein [Phaeoacremonium minimum UCRPA7]EOO04381.1 putative general alpha-glucoside permease protein [Phaeoacremonium minimum UCRPA7]
MTSSLGGSTVTGRSSVEGDRSNAKGKRPPALAGNTPRISSIDHARNDDVSEQSPLLSPASNENEDDGFLDDQAIEDEWEEFQQTKSVWYLILLTISIGGLQIAWSVELSNGSPYLLSLGLSKSLMALVWIAGPLSGTLVQPYVGMLSDKCRISWGKRKPFMLGGAAATICSLMILAWTKEIVGGFLGLFGADLESNGVKVSIIVVAVIWVYILDFAINTVQAAIRAFIVDCAPAHQQESANAMASRITGVGNIVGYVAGYVNLPEITWWLGNTQFKDLCAIASIALGATVIISCVFVKERDPRLEGPPAKSERPGVISFFSTIFTSIKRLPPQIKKVCIVQFCAWIGFFPMLFYTSSYIGEIYAEPFLEKNPNMTPKELDKLYEKATQVGTFALLIFSITSLATNVLLPFFIAPTYDSQPVLATDAPGEGPAESIRSFGSDTKSWLDYLIIPGFTLRRAWMFSQILFTISMFCTVFVRTVPAATALIGLVGITWALTLWAPWAIISAEISRRDATIRAQRQQRMFSPHRDHSGSPDGYTSDRDRKVVDEEEESDQAGVILGIHNMAIAAPQIIATFASSIIFRIFQKPRGVPGDHSIAIVLALGGITVLVAAFFVHLMKDDPTSPADALVIVEEADAGGVPSRPSTAHSRTRSVENLPRASLERATLTRNKSFGGAEY